MGANWGQIPILAQEIEAMIPRDMRKRASDLAPDDVAFQAAPALVGGGNEAALPDHAGQAGAGSLIDSTRSTRSQ